MRVVVTGACGKVGTSLLQAFPEEPELEADVDVTQDEWATADAAVVHLAWLI